MQKRVILITGTPCVGKTTVARTLASRLEAHYVNLTELAKSENLILGKDPKRDTTIVNEKKMKNRIRKLIETSNQTSIIIDGHYAVHVVPEKLATQIFVLRRNPVELRKQMEQSGYAASKLRENLTSEILDVCLVDALNTHGKAKICELDVTGESSEETIKEIIAILDDRKKCHVGIVDWIGKLENEGLLDEYLKI